MADYFCKWAIFVVIRPTPLKGPFESTFASCRTYCSLFPKSFCKKAEALYFGTHDVAFMRA